VTCTIGLLAGLSWAVRHKKTSKWLKRANKYGTYLLLRIVDLDPKRLKIKAFALCKTKFSEESYRFR
jgi:hypothetical protein